MRLTIERATVIGREFGGWFGTTLMSRCPVSAIRSPADILDGRLRYAALAPAAVEIPCLVFPVGHRKGIYSIGTRQYLLPRLLVLCGHPDRAWRHTPECWRDSVQALESFLAVPREAALEVWAAGKQISNEQKGKMYALRRPPRLSPNEQRSAREMVRMIRQGLRARAEGEVFDIADVAEVVGYK